VLPADVPLVSTSKGIHVATEQLMYDVIPTALGRPQPAAFLSGPSFAKEMMQQFPTTVVVASTDVAVAKAVQLLLSQRTFRVYTTTDVVGLEIGARLAPHAAPRMHLPVVAPWMRVRARTGMCLCWYSCMHGCTLARAFAPVCVGAVRVD
jgi:hypothetical protein